MFVLSAIGHPFLSLGYSNAVQPEATEPRTRGPLWSILGLSCEEPLGMETASNRSALCPSLFHHHLGVQIR